MIYLQLAIVFTVLSLLGFGGGNAIIPQMHADVVDSSHWITSEEFTRFFGLAKLAPGPTTTMAALVGYAVKGFAGATVATIAVFVPAGILVFAVGHTWIRFKGNPWRERFATAIKPVVLGLIWAGAVIVLAHGAIDGWVTHWDRRRCDRYHACDEPQASTSRIMRGRNRSVCAPLGPWIQYDWAREQRRFQRPTRRNRVFRTPSRRGRPRCDHRHRAAVAAAHGRPPHRSAGLYRCLSRSRSPHRC